MMFYEDVMRDALKGKLLTLDILFTEIFYVEKMTEELEALVSGSLYQEPDKFYLPAAVVKDSGKVYIADQTDSQGQEEYKEMKKDLMGLFGCGEKNID